MMMMMMDDNRPCNKCFMKVVASEQIMLYVIYSATELSAVSAPSASARNAADGSQFKTKGK